MKISTVLQIGLSIVIVLFWAINYADASTTFETSVPAQQEYNVDFVNFGSNTRYVNEILLPLGITFDRVQINVPPSQNGNIRAFGAFFLDNDDPFYSCPDTSCTNTDTFIKSLTNNNFVTGSLFASGTVQFNFSTTTTITNANQYVRFDFDPNAPLQNFFVNIANNAEVWSTTGSQTQRQRNGLIMRFCNGPCDSNLFTPLPNLTTTPWVRITSPIDNSIQPYTTPITIQANTGTTTADKVTLFFNSNFQSIAPVDFAINATGINTFNYSQLFPQLDDEVGIYAVLYSGTTTLYTTPVTTILIRENATTGNIDTLETCDQYNFVLGGICSVFVFLFVPSDSLVEPFTDVWDSIKNKAPFGYFTSLVNTALNLDQVAPAFIMPDIPFMTDIFTPLKTLLGSLLVFFYLAWLYKRVTNFDF